MKKIIKSLLFAGGVVLLISTTSCKKDKTNTTSSCQLTVLQNTGSDSAAVTYDSQGRVSKYGGHSYALYTFNYSGLTATADVTGTDTSYHPRMYLFLNANGNVVSMNTDISFGTTTYHYTYTFTYDADGHIILDEESNRDINTPNTDYTKDSMVYADGNMVAKYTFEKSNSSSYILYDSLLISYTTSPNKNGYYIWRYAEEPISQLSGWAAYYHLFGSSSKDLPASSKYYTSSLGLADQYIYSFLLNSDGFATDENISASGHYPGTYNRTFAYNCQ